MVESAKNLNYRVKGADFLFDATSTRSGQVQDLSFGATKHPKEGPGDWFKRTIKIIVSVRTLVIEWTFPKQSSAILWNLDCSFFSFQDVNLVHSFFSRNEWRSQSRWHTWCLSSGELFWTDDGEPSFPQILWPLKVQCLTLSKHLNRSSLRLPSELLEMPSLASLYSVDL